MKIVIAGSTPKSLIGFRGRLIERMVSLGHEVTALAGHEDAAVQARLRAIGAVPGTYALRRRGWNPVPDLLTVLSLLRCFRQTRAELVLAYTIKPVIWGGLAARIAGVPHLHAMITGLGNGFDGRSARRRLAARLLAWLCRLALARAETVIFQNTDDRDAFITRGIVTPERTRLVHGSGVDLAFYAHQPLPGGGSIDGLDGGAPVFACAARLIAAKGLREYAASARIIRREFPEARFRLAGRPEHGVDSVPMAEIESWVEEGLIEYVGELADTREFLGACHVYVLPSYYGEGLPRTLLEALAIGRPLLTTDSVGCRETVVPEASGSVSNGRLVVPRDADALAAGMRDLLMNRGQWPRMAARSHALARERYDVHRVNDALLAILGLDQRPAPQAPVGVAPSTGV